MPKIIVILADLFVAVMKITELSVLLELDKIHLKY